MKLLKRLARVVVTLLTIFIVLCVILYFLQQKLVFFPGGAGFPESPKDVNLAYEDLRIDVGNGAAIHAWWVPCENARGTAIFCHGNAGHIGHRVGTMQDIHNLGLNALIFDYQGYGNSDGSPSEESTYLDAEAAWKWVTRVKKVDPKRIVVWGRSLGGAVAVDLAHRHLPGALVAESTFTSLTDVGAHHYPFLPVRLLARYRYDSAAKVKALACPKMFLHSPDDEVVPFEFGKRLHDAAAEPKRFVSTDGDHNNGYRAMSRVDAFLDEVLGEKR